MGTGEEGGFSTKVPWGEMGVDVQQQYRGEMNQNGEHPWIQRGYWICQIAGWSLYLISGVVMTSIVTDGFKFRYLYSHLFADVILFLITHYSRYWFKKKKLFQQKLSKILGGMVSFVVMATLVGGTGVVAVLSVVSTTPGWSEAPSIFLSLTFVFSMWISLYGGFKVFMNYRHNEVEKWKLEVQLLESQITALKSRVNPHFVFNALNNIRSLVAEDPGKARTAISNLSTLLRTTLRFEEELVIPLEEELEIVEEYLSLERLHLEEKLQVQWERTPLTSNYKIPALGIQTLVENAIKHGISSTPGGGLLWIGTRETDDQLIITISNTGQLLQNGNGDAGTGLANLEKRLELFDDRSRFQIEQTHSNIVNAELTLPAYEDSDH